MTIEGDRINNVYGKYVAMTGLDWKLVNEVSTGGMKRIVNGSF